MIDRFGLILLIFAERAKTRIAQLQIELAWLKYSRSHLKRQGNTFTTLRGMLSAQSLVFGSDMAQMEVVSAKGSGHAGRGSISGGGET